MTNTECRMPKEGRKTEFQGFRNSFVIRHSSFGLCLAFTLLELLAVVAVSAVLAALLLAVLAKSKTSAQRIKCFSNLRQLGLATRMYWDENGGKAFRYRG